MAFNIVLIEPEIPNNTGNIGRLSLGTGSTLHLVKPFGFEITDTRLKRAGLDYWKHVNIVEYDDIAGFYAKNVNAKMVYFSSHGEQTLWDIEFEDEMFFVFGQESKGLPESITADNKETTYKIPLYSEHIRSLNLANAVSVVVFEGLRNINKG